MNPKISQDSHNTFLLALAFFVLYVATLCPTVFRGDSGEIIVAIWSGGVIHPPGYPLFTLLGKLFLFLVPVGEPAFKIGVLVALSGGIALGLLYRLIRELEVPALAALGAASLLGVSLTFWSQCNRVEVYSLHLVFALLALWQCLRFRNIGDEKSLYTACLAVGLGLAHHLTIVLLVPGLLVLCGLRLWTAPGLPHRLGIGIGLLLFSGLPLYLLLLLWSQNSAGYSCLGAPKTLEALWEHLSGKSYQNYLQPPTDASSWARALEPLQAIIHENWFGPLSVLVVLGGVILARRRAAVFGGVLLTAATVAGHALSYRIGDIAAYYLVPFALGTVLVGVMLGSVQQALLERGRPLALHILACFLLPVSYGIVNLHACNLHAARGVARLAQQQLRGCPPQAILLTTGDEATHSLLYTQVLQGIRPDVALISQSVLRVAFFEPGHHYIGWLESQHVPLLDKKTTLDPTLQDEFLADGYLIRLLEGPLKDRPLASTYFGISEEDQARFGGSPGLDWLKEHYFPSPYGVILTFTPKTAPLTPAQVLITCRKAWESIELPEPLLAPTATEVDGNYTPRHYVTMLCNYGFLYELNGQPQQAQQVYLVALDWCPELTQTILRNMEAKSPLAKQLCARLSSAH
ncbi:DUF2723 domain-containing protein [Armatimonas sp.]|uniref:glycosyltransferase family 117 protein n=1 Tax=Armatimonas sp. TaxID=1872638 RepID=UPI00286A09E1|nr:DUF2723 domain-containing protein [Armatimonas sp.]